MMMFVSARTKVTTAPEPGAAMGAKGPPEPSLPEAVSSVKTVSVVKYQAPRARP